VLGRVFKALLRCFHIQCRDIAEAPGDQGTTGTTPGPSP
jgi:hypothetical protein